MNEINLDNLSKLPSSLQFVIQKLGVGFLKYNTNSGFLLSREEFQAHKQDLDDISDYIKDRYPMNNNNQYCFSVDYELITNALKALMPDIEDKLIAERTKSCEDVLKTDGLKFIQVVQKIVDDLDVSPYNMLCDDDKEYTDKVILPMALYCINSGNSLVVDGQTYCAYKFNYHYFLNALRAVSEKMLYRCFIAHVDNGDTPNAWVSVGTMAATQCLKPIIRTDAATNTPYVAGVCFLLKIVPEGNPYDKNYGKSWV